MMNFRAHGESNCILKLKLSRSSPIGSDNSRKPHQQNTNHWIPLKCCFIECKTFLNFFQAKMLRIIRTEYGSDVRANNGYHKFRIQIENVQQWCRLIHKIYQLKWLSVSLLNLNWHLCRQTIPVNGCNQL